MITLLAMLFNYAIQFTIGVDKQTCTCSDIPQDTVCIETEFCQWNTTTASCDVLPCESATNATWCNDILPISYGCAWNNGCAKFTKCSDYIVSSPEDCYNIWFCSDGGQTANGKYVCADSPIQVDEGSQTVACNNQTSEETCIGQEDTDMYCVWNATSKLCESQSITQCSDATEIYCKDVSCWWNSTADECADQSCDLFDEIDCNFYLSFDQTQVTACLWDGKNCVDFGITDLSSEQCLNATFNTYVWNSIQARCIECASGVIISVSIVIMLLALNL